MTQKWHNTILVTMFNFIIFIKKFKPKNKMSYFWIWNFIFLQLILQIIKLRYVYSNHSNVHICNSNRVYNILLLKSRDLCPILKFSFQSVVLSLIPLHIKFPSHSPPTLHIVLFYSPIFLPTSLILFPLTHSYIILSCSFRLIFFFSSQVSHPFSSDHLCNIS